MSPLRLLRSGTTGTTPTLSTRHPSLLNQANADFYKPPILSQTSTEDPLRSLHLSPRLVEHPSWSLSWVRSTELSGLKVHEAQNIPSLPLHTRAPAAIVPPPCETSARVLGCLVFFPTVSNEVNGRDKQGVPTKPGLLTCCERFISQRNPGKSLTQDYYRMSGTVVWR